jgi:hypothetical protein
MKSTDSAVDSSESTGAPEMYNDFPLTIGMVAAGVETFAKWNVDSDALECILTDVFYSMLGAAPRFHKSSRATADSSSCTCGEIAR